jgi:small-conductance mechanosensitive channel
MDQVVAWFDRTNISLPQLLATVALIVSTALAIAALNRLLRRWVRSLEARVSLPYETVLVVTRVIGSCLWLVTALLVLNLWGIGLGGLWTLLASAVAVIGVGFLAVWTMVSNVTASFFITLWRPFRLGQIVEILPENLKGRVIDRNLMFTMLRDENGNLLQVPNNLFFQKMFRVTDPGKPSLFESLESGRKEADGNAAPPRKA